MCPFTRARDCNLTDIHPSHKQRVFKLQSWQKLPLTDDVMRLEMKH